MYLQTKSSLELVSTGEAFDSKMENAGRQGVNSVAQARKENVQIPKASSHTRK